jgi:hypothetical protein
MKTTTGPPENDEMAIDNVKISEFRRFQRVGHDFGGVFLFIYRKFPF